MLEYSRILILDTGIIINLFAVGVWDTVIDRFEIHVANSVIGEAIFYVIDNVEYPINLQPYIDQK